MYWPLHFLVNRSLDVVLPRQDIYVRQDLIIFDIYCDLRCHSPHLVLIYCTKHWHHWPISQQLHKPHTVKDIRYDFCLFDRNYSLISLCIAFRSFFSLVCKPRCFYDSLIMVFLYEWVLQVCHLSDFFTCSTCKPNWDLVEWFLRHVRRF